MSFIEFCERNQYYVKTDNLCASMRSYNAFIDDYASEKPEIEEFFNMKYENIFNKDIFISCL